jgi:membrane protease YdiL (CAAX protease family)
MNGAPTGQRARPELSSVVLGLLLLGGLSGALGGVVVALSPSAASGAPPSLGRIAGLVLLLAGLAAATAALGLTVFGPVRRGRLAAARGFGSHRVMLTATLFATLLGAVLGNLLPLFALLLTGQRGLRNLPGFLAAALSVSLVLLLVAYFRFLRPGVVSPASFGFGRNRLAEQCLGQTWLAHLVTGLGGGLLVLLLSGTVQAVLQGLGVQQTQLQDFTWVRQLPLAGFLAILFAGAVLAPLAEEIFFRGLVFQGYLQAQGRLTAYLVSSAVFALLHLNLPAFPPIFVLGLTLAWLYRATGSLLPAILAHGLNNGVAFVVLYFGPPGLGR